MQRVVHEPRPDWQAKVEAVGFRFHTIPGQGGVYWDEAGHWSLTAAEIDHLETATEELYGLCMQAAEAIVREKRYAALGIPPQAVPAIERSWERRGAASGFELYGRLDLAWTGGSAPPKLLEYNADTPTGLFEAAVVQWQWLEEWNEATGRDDDQFNSIHEKLSARWAAFAASDGAPEALHLTCHAPHPEDEGTVEYIAAAAVEAGLAVKALAIQDIGWMDRGAAGGQFVDLENEPIQALFKLYPWEFMVQEEFGARLIAEVARGRIAVIEPAWKMLLSNKAILAVLWEMFPRHPNLCEAHLDGSAFKREARVVAKPFLGREGANISIATIDRTGAPKDLEEGT
ncbi:MAG: glutathionylspermidine synthase family protein, partial [Alphaproteobacteria bacterium]|nr:glutathionylspermidine synthase family protein [Alphaproteobacteria bacterium]